MSLQITFIEKGTIASFSNSDNKSVMNLVIIS